MLKGFLIGVLGFGCFWFFFGRSDIKGVRKDLDTVHETYEQVQRDLDKVTTDSRGLTGDITLVNATSRQSYDRGVSIDEGLGDIKGNLGIVTIKIDELEQLNINLIRVGRDFGDVAYDIRELSKTYGENQ